MLEEIGIRSPRGNVLFGHPLERRHQQVPEIKGRIGEYRCGVSPTLVRFLFPDTRLVVVANNGNSSVWSVLNADVLPQLSPSRMSPFVMSA